LRLRYNEVNSVEFSKLDKFKPRARLERSSFFHYDYHRVENSLNKATPRESNGHSVGEQFV